MVHHRHSRHVARAAEPKPAPAQTLVSIVYVTASPTFTGAIAGYTTIGANDNDDKSTTEAVAAVPSTTEIIQQTSSKSASVQPSILAASSPTSTAAVVKSSSTSTPSVILAPSTSIASTIALLAATGSTTTSRSTSATSSATSATAASASSTGSADAEAGMSTGGKVGLAFGIICLIGVALSLALFFFKKRKDAAKHEQLDNEKNDIFAGNSAAAARAASVRTAHTAATAPRLSLRPITQNFAMFGADKRASRVNAMEKANSQGSVNQAAPATPSKSPVAMQGQEQNRSNPFGNHAETIDSANANGPPIVEGMSADGKIFAGSAIGVATTTPAVGLVRGASKRGNGPKPMDFTKPLMMPRTPSSPTGTEFSMSSEKESPVQPTPTGVAIAAAGGPPNTAVHRVQLDFKPSMDDELELKAGQLIRLLHEYDDGWALCIRLDRSQQGVVPRTCLSTRPVKPRPQQNGPRGPPPGMRVPTQNQRPMSPGMQGPPSAASTSSSGPRTPIGNLAPRPMTPNGNQNQPMTPNGNPNRPMTSGGNQNRPMTPNGNQNRPMTPNGSQPRPMTPNAGLQINTQPLMIQGQVRVRSPTITQGPAPRSPTGPSPAGPVSMNPVTVATPTPAPDSRPSTPQAQERPQGPPPAAQGAVGRKPVPGQAL